MKQQKKPSLWWLYALIVVCLAVSGVFAYRLWDKMHQQQESKDAYEQIEQEVVASGSVEFADQLAAALTEAEDAKEAEPVGEEPDEVLTVVAATRASAAGTPVSATKAPAGTASAPASTASASAATDAPSTAVATSVPSASAVQSVATAAPTASPAQTASSAQSVVSAVPSEASAQTASSEQSVVSAVPSEAPAQTTSSASSTVTVAPAASPAQTALPAQSTATALPTASPAPTAAPTENPRLARVVTMDEVGYSVDFGYLQSINADVKAWLIQDGTVINYPVMQAADNDYYLNHLFNRKINADGSLFMDCGNAAFFNEAITYIYGHHTKTDAMFSTLAEYRNQAYYDAHPQMTLLTPYGDFCIDLFAARVSLVADESEWRLKLFEDKELFGDYMERLEADSLFKCKETSKPEYGDQLLVLCTCTNEEHGERYVVYGRMRPILYGDAAKVSVTKMEMDRKETLTAWQNVPGRGQMIVYAQNDPLWDQMRYEAYNGDGRRNFGDGGCGPTAVAMVVANLTPKEELGTIFGYGKTSSGFTFCQCSVNQYFCSKRHAQYQIQQPDEYLRYYPLVMASFATGNNYWHETCRTKNAGTKMSFIKRIAQIYGYGLRTTTDNDAALEAVQNGAMAVCSISGNNPFTGGGHYITLASVDEEYAYFLDPYRSKDHYASTDKRHVLEEIADGVVRVKLENVRSLGISTSYVITRAQ